MTFASDLRRFANLTNQKMETVVKSSLVRIGTSIVVKSPVDTGRFRSNWLAAYGTADTTVNMSVDQSGQGVLNRLKMSVNGLNFREYFYFTNSLPYAKVCNTATQHRHLAAWFAYPWQHGKVFWPMKSER